MCITHAQNKKKRLITGKGLHNIHIIKEINLIFSQLWGQWGYSWKSFNDEIMVHGGDGDENMSNEWGIYNKFLKQLNCNIRIFRLM